MPFIGWRMGGLLIRASSFSSSLSCPVQDNQVALYGPSECKVPQFNFYNLHNCADFLYEQALHAPLLSWPADNQGMGLMRMEHIGVLCMLCLYTNAYTWAMTCSKTQENLTPPLSEVTLSIQTCFCQVLHNLRKFCGKYTRFYRTSLSSYSLCI